mmetsp:Transcript_21430/g.43457  ORF Transcript_21430/g.43457 Transcript_21430/m.43457 type:complete len:237 (-) Transcript_21430:2753-3463(-)
MFSLQVTVDNMLIVQVGYCIQKTQNNLTRPLFFQLHLLLNKLIKQIAAVALFHDNVHVIAILHDIHNLHNIGMFHSLEQRYLALEEFGILGVVLQHDGFDSKLLFCVTVNAGADGTKGAGADDFGVNFVQNFDRSFANFEARRTSCGGGCFLGLIFGAINPRLGFENLSTVSSMWLLRCVVCDRGRPHGRSFGFLGRLMLWGWGWWRWLIQHELQGGSSMILVVQGLDAAFLGTLG